MSDRERLLHDVAKYVARTAVNVPEGAPVPPALATLLLRDVYGREGEPRISETFDRWAPEGELAECRAELTAIDALEPRARSMDAEALSEIAARARRVAAQIRAWAT